VEPRKPPLPRYRRDPEVRPASDMCAQSSSHSSSGRDSQGSPRVP